MPRVPSSLPILPEGLLRAVLKSPVAGAEAVEVVGAAYAALRGPGEAAWKRPLGTAVDEVVRALEAGDGAAAGRGAAALHGALERAAGEAFAAALPAARAEAERADAIARAIGGGDALAGATPEDTALASVAPESGILRSFEKVRARHASWARRAVALLEAGPGGGLEAAERLRVALATAERARIYGLVLRAPAPVLALDEDFRDLGAPGNVVERLNRAYYAIRGASIYEDFTTLAKSDPTLSEADAAAFRRSAGGAGAGPLDVVEVGIGDGAFGASFLAALEAADPALLARVRYHFCDFSKKMLDDARRNPRLERFRDRLAFHEHDASAGGPLPVERPRLVRLHELLDDVPGMAVVYRDRSGAHRRASARAVVRLVRPLRRRDGSALAPEDLARAWRRDDRGALEDLAPETHEAIVGEARRGPPGDASAEVAGSAEGDDILFPVSEGPARFLVSVARQVAPGGGEVHAFDYAALYGATRRDYRDAAQIFRRYGGSATANVNLGTIAAAAAGAGLAAEISSQVEFVSEARRLATLRVRGLAPDSGLAALALHCSSPKAAAPLRALAAYDEVAAAAAAATSGAGGHDATGFARFAGAIRARGLVHPRLPLDFVPEADGPLDNLALELDVALSAAFRGPCLRAIARELDWFADPGELAAPLFECFRLGYDQAALHDALLSPEHEPLWAIVVRRPA